MRIATFLVCLGIFFLLTISFGRISVGNHWPERVDVSYGVSLTVMAAGGVLAAASLFALLVGALKGQTVEQVLPLVLASLGGLLLYQINWGVALALGMIGTAAVIGQHWGRPKG